MKIHPAMKQGFVPLFVQLLLITLIILNMIHRRVDAYQTSFPKPSDNDQVLLTVTVRDDDGRLVSNLPKTTFTIYDDKTQQEISIFQGNDQPLSIAIVFDLSRSMITEDTGGFNLLKESLKRFVELSHTSNEYFILGFANQSQLILDWTHNRDSVIQALTELKADRSSSRSVLFDACYVAIDKLRRGSHSRQVILLMTDGQESNSHHNYNQVERLFQESNVVLYSMGFVQTGDPLVEYGKEVLSNFCNLSGGLIFVYKTKSQIKLAFESVASELRNQYVIGFKPIKSGDDKVHKVKVDVKWERSGKKLSLQARTRKVYYSVKGTK